MSKSIRILVVLHLVLACVALSLGVMLFNKREEMKGRTQLLENAVIAIASTVERDDPAPQSVSGFPERDIDVVDGPIESPATMRFWPDYRLELEQLDGPTMDLSARRPELMRYYRIDPVTLKVARDPASGDRATRGPGTMRAVLDDVVLKAEAQHGRLECTRVQLRALREEMVDAVSDLNVTKGNLRFANRAIRDRDATVAELLQTVGDRDQQLAQQQEETRATREQLADVRGELMRSEDALAQSENDIAKLQFELEKVMGRGGPKPGQRWAALTRGEKGRVVAVDTDWDFVVLHFSREFIEQYRRLASFGEEAPDPQLAIMREGGKDAEFVTMVQLCWVNPDERLGVANILSAWEQQAVSAGDSVIY